MSHWTAQDRRYLLKHWGARTPTEIGRVLGRSGRATRSKAETMGLFASRRMDRWTAREDKLLLAHVGGQSARAITALLPGRTRDAIIGRAMRLRVKTGHPLLLQPPTRGDAVLEPRHTPSLPRLSFMESSTWQ